MPLDMDTAEAGRLGGFARAKKLSKKRKIAIGKLGGVARAAKLKPGRRRKIAKNAANVRWGKNGSTPPS